MPFFSYRAAVVRMVIRAYESVVDERLAAVTGDVAALRKAAGVIYDSARGIGEVGVQVAEDAKKVGCWHGRARHNFDEAIKKQVTKLELTSTAAGRCGDAMEILVAAMEKARSDIEVAKGRLHWTGEMLVWIADFPFMDLRRLLSLAVRYGDRAVAAAAQATSELDARLTEFIQTVLSAIGETGRPIGTPAPAPAPGADPPGWNQHYTSPDRHPDVVGTRRVHGEDVPRYDMTGHLPPSTRPAGNLDQWVTDAKAVLAANGVDTSSMTDADLRALIRHESAGDPYALNDWDRNARHGIPSKGLMQTIDQTFNDYSVPGHRDIWNPVDNIVAGVRYAIARYGSFDNIPGIRALHHGHDYVGY